jgi:hypothetical protein
MRCSHSSVAYDIIPALPCLPVVDHVVDRMRVRPPTSCVVSKGGAEALPKKTAWPRPLQTGGENQVLFGELNPAAPAVVVGLAYCAHPCLRASCRPTKACPLGQRRDPWDKGVPLGTKACPLAQRRAPWHKGVPLGTKTCPLARTPRR